MGKTPHRRWPPAYAGALLPLLLVALLLSGGPAPSSPFTHPTAPTHGTAGTSMDRVTADQAIAGGATPGNATNSPCPPLEPVTQCYAGLLVVPPAPRSAPRVTWTNLTPHLDGGPPPRYTAMMTYDAADGLVLLFGGASGSRIFGDTWSFQGGQWHNLTPQLSEAPTDRYIGSMAYDPVDHYVVLFGGNSGSGTIYSDTWTFSNNSWTEIYPTSHPSARWRSNLAFDAADGYLLLFGGSDATNSSALSDTWSFVHGSWTNLTSQVTGSPTGRFRSAMSYDSEDGEVLLFGGCTSVVLSPCATSDTWSYVNKTWTDLNGAVGTPPGPRIYPGLADDPALGAVVLFGGTTQVAGCGTGCTNYPDTWTFSGGNWSADSSNLSRSPPARGFESLVYVPDPGYLLMFGGGELTNSSIIYLNDTWILGPAIVASATATPSRLDIGQVARLQVATFSAATFLNYSYAGLPLGCSSANTSTLNCTPEVAGSFTVTIFANDTRGDSSNVSLVLQVWLDPVVRAFALSPSPITAGALMNVSATVGLGAPGGYTFTYASLPGGCAAADAATFSCRPAAAGNFTVELTANDSDGYHVEANASVVVHARPGAHGFYATLPTTDVNLTTVFVATIVNGTPPYAYVYSGLPSGCATQNASTLACTPRAAGFFTVDLNVTDVFGFVARTQTLLAVHDALSVVNFRAAHAVIDLGQPLSISVSTTGGTGAPDLVYANVPAGCQFGNSTVVGCVPTAVGQYNVTVNATDALGETANATLTITVNADPAVTSLTVSTALIDLTQSFVVNASVGGGTAPIRLDWVGVPPGCGVPTTLLFTCTPSGAGTFWFSLSITDAAQRKAVSSSAAVRVLTDPSIVSLNESSTAVTAGLRWTLTVDVTGGSGGYTYQYTQLPAGCMSEDGPILSCEPSAAGNYSVAVRINDSLGGVAQSAVVLNVTAAPVVPPPTAVPPMVPAYVFLILLAIAAVMGLTLLRLRRRSPPEPTEASPTPPAVEKPIWLEE